MRTRKEVLARIEEESAIFAQQMAEAREAFRAFAERGPADFSKLAS